MRLHVTTLFLKPHGADYSNKDFVAQLGNDFIVGEQEFLRNTKCLPGISDSNLARRTQYRPAPVTNTFGHIIHKEPLSLQNYFAGILSINRPAKYYAPGMGFFFHTATFGIILASFNKSACVLYQIRSKQEFFLGQAHSKVITVEADLQSRSLPSPRFDEVAAQMARPVVPLNKGFVSASPRSITNPRSQASPVLSKKGSWLLAAFVGIILTAGAMAIGVTAYKRSPAAVSTPALIQTAEAISIELNQEPRRGQSFRSRRTPAATKNNKHVRRARPAFDGRPRARLVDVLR